MGVSLKLTFMSGQRDGETVQVQLQNDLAEAVLGRLDACEVCCLDDPELSRRHARLLWDGKSNTWQLEDLNSTNGTFVGEFKQARRINQPVSLTYGEIFRIGHTCLRLESPAMRELEAAAEAYAEAQI